MPQSISFASLQVSVNSRFCQLTGSTNSSDAARIATMPSSSRPLTSSYALDSSPAMIATMPGAIHNVTATPNAISVFFLRDMRPSLLRSSATYSSTPSSFLTSGRLSVSRITHSAADIARQIGSAARNHSRNAIFSPVASSISPRPIRFGGLPTGVSRPPTLAP